MQLTFLHILYINQLDVGLGWGGSRCQFFKYRGGLQVILLFEWYIFYSNSTSLLLNDFLEYQELYMAYLEPVIIKKKWK